jgi:hypothetical protein
VTVEAGTYAVEWFASGLRKRGRGAARCAGVERDPPACRPGDLDQEDPPVGPGSAPQLVDPVAMVDAV